MGLWAGLIAAAAASSISLAAQGDDPARNQCRADCGAAWLTASACVVRPDAVVKVKPIQCRKKADKAYQACLAGCEPAGAGAGAGAGAEPDDKAAKVGRVRAAPPPPAQAQPPSAPTTPPGAAVRD
jgi:hypothetical protein